MGVSFHNEQITFDFQKRSRHTDWIDACIDHHRKIAGEITFIFTSNAHLLRINKAYLNHDYFTDVITFDYSEGEVISGDIFISIEQVEENASIYGAEREDELRRVMIHGVLHLIGFSDQLPDEQEVMKEMENEALHLWLKVE
ncbi:MAG: rRNA maturation RNase YbeY [Bacteroidota bacterium]